MNVFGYPPTLGERKLEHVPCTTAVSIHAIDGSRGIDGQSGLYVVIRVNQRFAPSTTAVGREFKHAFSTSKNRAIEISGGVLNEISTGEVTVRAAV